MTAEACTLNDMALIRPRGENEMGRMLLNWKHWQANAEKFQTEHDASWGDKHAIELEVANLIEHLSTGGRLLDVGCGNGYTTFRALARQPDLFRAIDFSSEMIEQAQLAQKVADPECRITFSHGNVLEIDEPDASFDQAYCVRVLINLASWDAQQDAIGEIHRVLKPGGRYILSEAFSGSQTRLNTLRELAGLPPLKAPEFNLYLEEERVESFLRELFHIEKVELFSSLYYVATRFVRELVADLDSHPNYDHPINQLFGRLKSASNSGDFGIQKAYILTKI